MILGSNDVIQEAYVNKKNDFAGRHSIGFLREIFLVSKNSSDIIFEDFTKSWEIL